MTNRFEKYRHHGLLTPLGSAYFNPLIEDRISLLKITEHIPDQEFHHHLEHIDITLPHQKLEYYSSHYQRNLTSAELLTIYTIGMLDEMLDSLKDDYSPLPIEIDLFVDLFQKRDFVWKVKMALAKQDQAIKAEKRINEMDSHFSNVLTELGNHEAAQRHRSLDRARRGQRKHFKTNVIYKIVKIYYEENKKRIPLEKALTVIVEDYCGEEGLISDPDDIDYMAKTIEFYSKPYSFYNDASPKKIKFTTLNNLISKQFKKIIS